MQCSVGYWLWVTWTNSLHSVNLLTSLKSNHFTYRVVFAKIGNFKETFSRSRSNLQFWDARMTHESVRDIAPMFCLHLLGIHNTIFAGTGHTGCHQVIIVRDRGGCRQGELEGGRNWLEHKMLVSDWGQSEVRAKSTEYAYFKPQRKKVIYPLHSCFFYCVGCAWQGQLSSLQKYPFSDGNSFSLLLILLGWMKEWGVTCYWQIAGDTGAIISSHTPT